MAGTESSIDEVFQEWDDQRVKLQGTPVEQQADKFGPWASLIGQRQKLFVERWRPDRIKVSKRIGSSKDADAAAVRGTLTPLARDEFVADLRTWGVPDRYAVAAGSLVEVK